MATVSGTTATRGAQATNPSIQIIPNVSDRIFQAGAAELGFLRLLRKLKKRSVTDVSFTNLTDARLDYTVIIDGALNSSVTTAVFDSTSVMRPWDVWMDESTKEHFFISSVDSSTNCTVIRAHGTTAAAAVADNQRWRKIALAMSDGSAAPESRQTVVGSLINYTQWVSNVIDLTEQQGVTGLYGGKEKPRQTKMTMFDFQRSLANMMYFGEPLLDIDNSSPLDSALVNSRTTSGGLEYFINNDSDSSNIILDAGGILTQDLLWDWIGAVNKNDPSFQADGELGKVLLASAKVVKIINKWNLNHIQTDVATKTFGSNVATYKSPFGILNVVYDLLLEGDEYGDYAFLVNPANLDYVFLNGKDMAVKTNIQLPNVHTESDEIYGCIGLGFNGPVSANGMLKNAAIAG